MKREEKKSAYSRLCKIPLPLNPPSSLKYYFYGSKRHEETKGGYYVKSTKI